MCKVSVIIPVYNTEKYLEQCLNSVINQTLQDIEIICINDCSTDNSLQILKNYAQKDKRIKIIDLKENKGVSYARNTGINKAIGEYIGFVDSDDFIDLDFYAKLYNKARETNADAVKGNIWDYDIDTKSTHLSAFYDINDKIIHNFAYFTYGFTSAIYSTKSIKDNNIYFPENIIYFEDPYFSINMCICANKIEVENSANYYYLKHNNSICHSQNVIPKAKSMNTCIEKIFSIINNKNLKKEQYICFLDFIFNQTLQLCNDSAIGEENNKNSIKILAKILDKKKVSTNELFKFHFQNKKENLKRKLLHDKDSIIQKIRKIRT